MTDERLKLIKTAVAEKKAEYGSVRISRLKISNYKFFFGDFELDFNGGNVLIYGENGSGKSSIYKALSFLAKDKFKSITSDRNIFCEGNEPQIEFAFTNGRELIIDSDLMELPDSVSFLKGLSVFSPMLDYKKLLRVHYAHGINGDAINVYSMLSDIFKDYAVEKKGKLSNISDFMEYFDTLKKIVNGDLLSEINSLIRFFNDDFKIIKFNFRMEKKEDGNPEPVVNIDIDFKDNQIAYYHSFLNEARLSALAISIYFACIRKLISTIGGGCLKILVLDDLLISLDMSNRQKLLEILKTTFTDFQIFFFTHDKELFELYKDKLPWVKYELYLDDSTEIPNVIKKVSSSFIERAKEYYSKKDYDCCANLLRKEFEKMLKAHLTPKEQRDDKCNELDLAGKIRMAILKNRGETKTILEKLNSDRKNILNPLSHDDDRNVYSPEIKLAISDLEKLKAMLK